MLGFQSLAIDLGIDLKVPLSAARSIASRSGLRKTKHAAVKYLWVQDAVRDGRFTVKKLAGVCSLADIKLWGGRGGRVVGIGEADTAGRWTVTRTEFMASELRPDWSENQ